MKRRRALRLALGLPAGFAATLLLGGHTPYRQWEIYRKKHLLIGCHKADPETYDIAKRIVALLADHLPAAKSRVARAPNAGRLASLLGTAQMDVATLDLPEAAAMAEGTGAFEPYGRIVLRLLTPVDGRLLVARADFPERHAWLVTSALSGSDLVSSLEQPGDPGIPWHPGSLAFLEDRPAPGDG
ncbi:MAG: hypothetical protein AAF637_12040 [Pseudomonadota bacterium]